MDNWLAEYFKRQSNETWDRINGGKGVIRWPGQPQPQPAPQQKPKPASQKGTGK
jgi:hypothetical protein